MSYVVPRRRRESVQDTETVSSGRFQAHPAEGRALGRQQVWALEVTELKGILATPHRDFARPDAAGGRRGLADGTVRRGKGAEGIRDLGIQEKGGWGAALPSQTCLFPLPPCWKNPGSIWLLGRKGGREGDVAPGFPPGSR